MRRLIILAVAVMLVGLTGCSKYKDIKITSAVLENISPYGLRGAEVALAVEIDNPTVMAKISDIEAEVEYSGKVLGKVTLDPFTLKRKTVETYHLKGKLTFDQSLTLADLIMVLDKNFIENCLVDFTAKGTIRGGLSKTVTRNDVPLKKLLEYAENKK